LIAEPLQVDIQGEAGLLMNAQSGAILFEQEAFTPRYPASTTKVATALYALKLKGEELDLPIEAEQESLVSVTQEAKRKSNFTLPGYWLEPDGTNIGIKKGEILTLHDLLRGLLIPSGNDAANVIAQALGPSIPQFMEGLNAYLQEIGCEQTFFCNPHGLHDAKHQTTPYDLALIMREALKNPVFCDIIAQSRFVRPKTDKQAATTLLQGNRLMRPGKFHYAKAIGGKTGYHAKAKNTFVGAAQSNGRTLIVVLFGYSERQAIFQDAIKLFDAAFNQPKVQRRYVKAGPQPFTQDLLRANCPLHTYLEEALSLDYYPAEDPEAKCLLYWETLELPVLKDQKVGELHLVNKEGRVLKKVALLASEEVNLTWLHRRWAGLPSLPWLLLGGIGVGFLLRTSRRRS
jgi:D-alanyl-D-alanine carboxypeptidase (penicillin-binding protein 5/6)